MSAENTDIETQTKEHRGSLWGMGFAVFVALVLLVAFLYAVATPDVDEVEALVTTPQEETD